MDSPGIHNGQEVTKDFDSYSLKLVFGHSYFSDEICQKVIADLGPRMPDLDVSGYFRSQPSIFTDYDFLLLATESEMGTVIGLLGGQWMSTPTRRFLYVRTAQIAHTMRSSLLYPRMQSFMFSGILAANGGAPPELIVMKTHNPRAFSLMRKYFGRMPGVSIFPRLPGRSSSWMSEIAEDIAMSLWPASRFSVQTGVLYGVQAAISPNFFPRIEPCRDDDVNDHFQSSLTRDDQILCIVHIPTEAHEAIRNELRAVPGLRAEPSSHT